MFPKEASMPKCVLIIDRHLPVGLIANASAVLAMSVGARIDGLIGEDVCDRDGGNHRGITTIPVPLLQGDRASIRDLRHRLQAAPEDELFVVDFCEAAQRSRTYAEYRTRMQTAAAADLNYLGIAIYGPTARVNRLTGHIGLLR
jgi:hypothetical protein